mmetsp:Transcript_35020/g.75881  ORF Transcript_35020/g.75881 Transcript_35020/m.75881 type:complete len:98 (+) Transcript_35020:1218-1511(+)
MLSSSESSSSESSSSSISTSSSNSGSSFPSLEMRWNLYSGGSGGKNVSAPATADLEQPLLTHKQKRASIAGGQQQHIVGKDKPSTGAYAFREELLVS